MITREVLEAFNDEMVKMALSPGKAKALGLLGVGVGTGMLAEQAKDDLLSGRRQRYGQARAMGMNRFIGVRT